MENGALFVDIHFLNGEASLARTIDMTGGSLEVLSRKVQSQIDTLNTTDLLAEEIVEGDFTPMIPESKLDPLNELRKIKEFVNLGVVDAADPKVQAAIDAAKQVIPNQLDAAIKK